MIVTGTQRPAVYCKICKKGYIDFCLSHCAIIGSWELRYECEHYWLRHSGKDKYQCDDCLVVFEAEKK